jgi:hypothetical protein
MQREFEQQYLGEFATMEMPTEDLMAIHYHLRCEIYDRMVCSGKDVSGDAKPMNSYQLMLVNRNALEVRTQLQRAHPEMREGAFGNAIRKWGNKSHEYLLRISEAISGASR